MTYDYNGKKSFKKTWWLTLLHYYLFTFIYSSSFVIASGRFSNSIAGGTLLKLNILKSAQHSATGVNS